MPFFGIDGVGWLGSRWSGPVVGTGGWGRSVVCGWDRCLGLILGVWPRWSDPLEKKNAVHKKVHKKTDRLKEPACVCVIKDTSSLASTI